MHALPKLLILLNHLNLQRGGRRGGGFYLKVYFLLFQPFSIINSWRVCAIKNYYHDFAVQGFINVSEFSRGL